MKGFPHTFDYEFAAQECTQVLISILSFEAKYSRREKMLGMHNTVEVKSLHPPFKICKMLIIYINKRGHTKCMLLFI